jgi:oligopeptide transport system ATP-binding protein
VKILTSQASELRRNEREVSMTGQQILSVRNLDVAFRSRHGRVPAVRGLSFQVGRGEVFAIVGESGSGKSTVALALMGLLPPGAELKGDLLLSDLVLNDLSPRHRRRIAGERMALISQDALSGLNPCTTVGFQIAETLMVHRGTPKREAMAEAVRLLTLTGIPSPHERVNHYPHEYSGGMRQRALIAMALALQPEVLIADEPTTALDATIKAQILQLLMDLRRELNMSVVIITHDMGVVARMADRMLVMYAGQAVEMGDVQDVFATPAHPYTRALLAAIPRLDQGPQHLLAIPGQPPSPANLPIGCPFHPRCAQHAGICKSEPPVAVQFNHNRLALCHFAPEVSHATTQ